MGQPTYDSEPHSLGLHSLLPAYEAPADPLAAEMALIDTIHQQHPEMDQLLKDALHDLGRFTGFARRDIKIDDPDFADPAIDEDGYLSIKKIVNARIRLSPYEDMPPEDYKQLSEGDRMRYVMGSDKGSVVGEFTPGSKAMLEGLYSLTGAKVAKSEPHEIIRAGSYHGVPIFFKEEYSDWDFAEQGTLTVLTVRCLSESSAMLAIDRPTREQQAAFEETSGMSRAESEDMVLNGDLTTTNIDHAAAALEAAKRIIDKSSDEV